MGLPDKLQAVGGDPVTMMRTKHPIGKGVRTGHVAFDESTHGGPRLGEIVAVVGAPGSGKTSFVEDLAVRYAARDHEVVFMMADRERAADRLANLARDVYVYTGEIGARISPIWPMPDDGRARPIAHTVSELRTMSPQGVVVVMVDGWEDLSGRLQDEILSLGEAAIVYLVARTSRTSGDAFSPFPAREILAQSQIAVCLDVAAAGSEGGGGYRARVFKMRDTKVPDGWHRVLRAVPTGLSDWSLTPADESLARKETASAMHTHQQHAHTIVELTEPGQISLIVGAARSGKTGIAREIAKDHVCRGEHVLFVTEDRHPVIALAGVAVVDRSDAGKMWYDGLGYPRYPKVIVYDAGDIGEAELEAVSSYIARRGARAYLTRRIRASGAVPIDAAWKAAANVFEVDNHHRPRALVLGGREICAPGPATEEARDETRSVDTDFARAPFEAPPTDHPKEIKMTVAHHKTLRPESLRYDVFTGPWRKWTVAQQATVIATLARLFPLAEVTATSAGLALYVRVPEDTSLEALERRIEEACRRLIGLVTPSEELMSFQLVRLMDFLVDEIGVAAAPKEAAVDVAIRLLRQHAPKKKGGV